MSEGVKRFFPDFSNLEASYLAGKVRESVEAYRGEIEVIRSVPQEEATFENTVLALEQSGKQLEVASAVYFNLLSCHATDELMEQSEELAALLSDLSNEVDMDLGIAEKVRQVYQKQMEELSPIDRRLTFRAYQGYERRGAFLEERVREQLKELRKKLSLATLHFGQNLLKEQGAYRLSVLDAGVLKRLPKSAMETAQQKAEEEGVSGYLFDFSAPSYLAIMKYCSSRTLREKMYRDRGKLGYNDTLSTSNRELVYEIVGLRHQIAELLGYDSYAAYVLHSKMAKSSETVLKMLGELRDAYMPTAKAEVAEVRSLALKLDDLQELMPWDWSYYAELYKEQHLAYDEEQTRPYLELTRVVQALFDLAAELYDLKIVPNGELKPYHKEVKVFDVLSSEGRLLGTLMTDFFPRKEKRSGAWMTNYVEAYGDVRPVVSLVMNFTPPTEGMPSLLTIDEVSTLFHEFGHGLHGLLTQVPYASLSGTNVVHDFVELPSHFHENWVRQPDFLQRMAVHYQTGEPMPAEMMEGIKKNNLFLEGYSCIRQLGFGYLDMKWHTTPPEQLPKDIEELEHEVAEPIRLLPEVEGVCTSTAFSHIFSGGYAAGYYGYKWSEILEADAFQEFLEHGLYDHATALRFKQEILERGDADDPDVLYRNFKGRDATIEAVKKRSGIK